MNRHIRRAIAAGRTARADWLEGHHSRRYAAWNPQAVTGTIQPISDTGSVIQVYREMMDKLEAEMLEMLMVPAEILNAPGPVMTGESLQIRPYAYRMR